MGWSLLPKCSVTYFDVITSIKYMESMECMYEKVSVALLRFALHYVTFCGIHRNIMYLGTELNSMRMDRKNTN